MATQPNLDSLAKDFLRDVDIPTEREKYTLWFLYDDLDKDLKGEVREKALIGLFQLVRACHGLRAIRFKIFLREDIWSLLTFDGKSYFNGRNLLLRWTSAEHLQEVWQETVHARLPQFREFSQFISFLKSIGVIALIARSNLNGPIYGVGPVYQHIFGWSTTL